MLVREQIAIDLEANGLASQRSIMQRILSSSLANSSVVQPGMFFAYTGREVAVLGGVIVEAIQKVLSSISLPRDETQLPTLLEIFDSEFESVLTGIRLGFADQWGKISGRSDSGRFEVHVEKIRRAKKHAIRLLVEKHMKEESNQKAGTVLDARGAQIGILQSGETNLVGGTTVNIGSTETKELREALRAIAERLDEVESLNETEKSELRDVAIEAKRNLQDRSLTARGFVR